MTRALVAGALLCGCTQSLTLVVDVKTDLVSGVEFATVRAEVHGRDGLVAFRDYDASSSDDFAVGVQVAELSGLEPGTYTVRASLLDGAGRSVAQRPIAVTLQTSTAVTVLFTRDCRGVMCPTAGAPGATACLGGRCVPPECTPENPDACPIVCTSDADCSSAIACVDPRCAAGACLTFGVDGRCADGFFCDPDVGCAPDPRDPRDAGARDAGGVDAGLDAGGSGPVCRGGFPDSCGSSLGSLGRFGMGSFGADTTDSTDQWSSACGGSGAPDETTDYSINDEGMYRFDFDGEGTAAISIRDASCTGVELGCGVGTVTVSLTSGQLVSVIVESAQSSSCVTGTVSGVFVP